MRKLKLMLILMVSLITFALIPQKMDCIHTPISATNIHYDQSISAPAESLEIVVWNTNGIPISMENFSQSNHQIISDGAGGAIIAWKDERNSEWDIYAQRIDSNGQIKWSEKGIAICTSIGDQYAVQLVSDGVGGAIITWSDERNSGTTEWDIYAQRINSTGDIQWTENGTAICTANLNQEFSQLASDGASGAIIIWQDYRNSEWDIYAQRINSTGDIQWTENGTVICTAIREQYIGQLVSDESGGAIITWEDDRKGNNYDIYVQKVNSTGDIQWTENGTKICTEIYYQRNPLLINDGPSGAIIAWQDERNSKWDIYAQRVNSTGEIQWTENGTIICTAIEYQFLSQIVSDRAGGAIITWFDLRNSEEDIYAQRVNSTGDTQWTPNGTTICTANLNQNNPRIATDGTGGAIITWEDYRASEFLQSPDIYAQRIDSSGKTQWIANGTIICTATREQRFPRLVSDGANGAIIIWQDNRNYGTTDWDIYAQRVNENNIPISNHPGLINTSKSGIETIGWILYDDWGGGQYRVWANDTLGNLYIWQDWQLWIDNSSLNVPINRTELGIFNYTIEYYDMYFLYGEPDTVIVTITNGDSNGDSDGGVIMGYDLIIISGAFSLIITVVTIRVLRKRKSVFL